MDMDSRKIVDIIVESAFDKKGENIVVMDMQEITQLCDYFVIVTGFSRPQTRAIAVNILEKLEEKLGVKKKRIQGKQEGGWILMDFGAVVVHVFLDNLRDYYDLEGLWKDAKFEHPIPASTQGT
jgi:ribosome-associated protein